MIQQTLNRYKLLEKLGEGGMGEVFLAQDTTLDRVVALKFLFPKAAADLQADERFRFEAKAAAALNHPNIITVHEIGEFENRAYIAMEYVNGKSLRDVMKHETLSIERILSIMREICEGLQKAHNAGIIHRDIKPENIMIDEDGHVRILDFGLAKAKEHMAFSDNASSFGTIAYMSPERCEGEETDERSDIWALGVLMYEMLTGHIPYPGDHEVEVLYAIVNLEREPLAGQCPANSAKLQEIVDTALAVTPEQRYQSIEEMLQAIRESEFAALPPTKNIMPILVALIVVFIFIAAFVFYTLKSTPRAPATHKQVTFVGNASLPVVSPNEQALAYMLGDDGNRKLVVEDFASNDTLELFSKIKHTHSLNWVPNSDQIAFTGVLDTLAERRTFIKTQQGDKTRHLRSLAFVTWSPDGAYIAHLNTNWKGFYISNAKTNQFVTNISIDEEFLFIHGLDWSPAMNWLAFATANDQSFAIWTVNIKNTKLHKLVQDTYELSPPRWSANGKSVYYFRTIGRVKQLMKVKVNKKGKAASEPTILQDGLEARAEFSISNDNKRLYYTREKRFSNLVRISFPDNKNTADFAKPQPLTTGTFINFSPSISPDNKLVAFSRARGNAANIFTVPLLGGQKNQLTLMDAYINGIAWSPDGQKVAFGSQQKEGTKIWLMDGINSEPSPFAESRLSRNTFSIEWAPGKDILYHRPGHRNFYMIDPQTGREKPLLPDDSQSWIFAPRYSNDGKSVAMSRTMQFEYELSGLWRFNLADSSLKLIQRGNMYPLIWSTDDKWIYAWSRENGKNDIAKVPADSGRAEHIITLPADELEGLCMTSDGRHIVYAPVEKQSDIWYTEHFDPKNELDQPVHFVAPIEYQQLVYREKAGMLYEQNKHAEEEAVYRQGLKLDDKNMVLQLGLAMSLVKQKKYAEAEKIYENARNLDPDRFYVLYQLAWLSFANRRYEKSIRLIHQCLDFQDLRPQTRQSLLIRLGAIATIQEDYAGAYRYFNEASLIDSASVQLVRQFCYLLALQKQYEKALMYAERLLASDSSFAAYNVTSWLLAVGEIDSERSIKLADKAMNVKPDDWSQTVQIYPYYAIPEYTLGLIYLQRSDYAQAEHYLNIALTIDPERPEIRDALSSAQTKKPLEFSNKR